MQDWNPESYAKFRGLRLRPALDLLAQLPGLPAGDAVDLGCGDGAVAEALALRLPHRRLLGVDNSPAMLKAAEETAVYSDLTLSDVESWQPQVPPALIFSNAALQWLPDHAQLLPHLAGLLAPGGVLAVQMPRQQEAPSHALMREVAERLFPGRHGAAPRGPRALTAEAYWRMLAPLGEVLAWESDYVQYLAPWDEGHPVRRFTQSTGLRPWLEPLSGA
ncbi:methyltransferase domain-containing protein, partial [Thioclava sp. BHET1]